MVPPFANSNRPRRRCIAPVNAPFSWPKSSEDISDGARAAQFTLTKARCDRRDRLWMARAISSLPVPVSPLTRTLESVGATFISKHSLQRRRGADDLFEHERLVDLLPEHYVFGVQLISQTLNLFKRFLQLGSLAAVFGDVY